MHDDKYFIGYCAKSSLLQPFLFLIRVSLYGFPRLFTLLLSISVFLLFSFYTFLVVGSVR